MIYIAIILTIIALPLIFQLIKMAFILLDEILKGICRMVANFWDFMNKPLFGSKKKKKE